MKHADKLKQYYHRDSIAILIIICVAILGVTVLVFSHAASPYATDEAESGVLSGIATLQSGTNASGGRYVEFGQATTSITKAGVGTPLACPANSVQVSPGHIPSMAANTNYCFAAGTYSGFSVQILTGDGFYGQGTATLNGNNSVESAMYTAAPSYAVTPPTILNVTIDGFNVENYADPTGSADATPPGAINLYGINDLTLSNNSVGPVSEVGIQLGGYQCCGQGVYGTGLTNSTVTHNTVHNTGFSGLSINGATKVMVSYNAVSYANTWNVNKEESVAGLGKFDSDTSITVINNDVFNNNAHGIWFDVYDSNNTIDDNIVGPGNIAGIFYEISYNAVISGNTITDNGAQDAGDGLAAPGAGIRISSSGGVSTYPGPQSITVSNNTLTGNHEGIVAWDGHTTSVGAPIPVANLAVTNNTITTSSSDPGASSTSDAWAAYLEQGGDGNTFTDNTYTLYQNLFGLPTGTTAWSGWKAAGYDTAGSCKTTTGESC
jgi:hypothetical protein